MREGMGGGMGCFVIFFHGVQMHNSSKVLVIIL